MYPFICGCGHLQMIDMEHLERQTVDKLYDAEGYICGGCGNWVTVFITTQSLDSAMRKLDKIRITRPDYRFHLLKTLKKATAIQQKAAFYG